MGFNPSSFPPIADAERLRTEADKFKTKADKVEDLASDSFNSWSSMPGVYEAPEASIVYGAFAPVKTSGQDLADDAATLKSAVDTYAGEAESIKTRYETLMSRWRAVEAQKASDDEWQEDEELVKEDNDILSDANALLAEYMAAQRACANKISGIYGGPTYVPTTQEGAGAGEVQFGFTGDQLDAAAAEGKLPWGEPSEYDAPWYEDTWNAVASFGKGVWSGVTGTVTGLYNMVNFTDWDTFSTTWKGIGTLAVDVAVLSSPVGLALSDTERKKEAAQRLLAVGKSAIHWDKWQEDPAYAAGASTFDLATILLTAGAGAVTKTGSVASKISKVSGAGTKVGTAVKVTGMGSVANVTVKVADLATDLKIKSLDLSTSVGREALGKLGPVASRIDDGLNAMSGPSPAYAGIGSPGPRAFSDAVDAGISRMDSQASGGGNGVPVSGGAGTGASSLHGGGDLGTPPPAQAAGASDGGGSGSNAQDGDSPQGAPATGTSDGAGADSNISDGSNADSDAEGDAPATLVDHDPETDTNGSADSESEPDATREADETPSEDAPAGADDAPFDGGSPEQGTATDTPAHGGDADGNGAGDRDRATDAPKATVTEWNDDGTPKAVQLPNGDKHTISMSSDQLAASRLDHGGNPVSSREVIIQHANSRGISARDLEEMIHTPVEQLTVDEIQTLVEIRHSIELSGGEDTMFQKAIISNRVDGMLDNTAPKPEYRTHVGGFVSDGADSAHLRTPGAIIDGLRLDYDGSPYDRDSMHVVRFQTPETEGIGIPDERARASLPDGHPYKDLPDLFQNILPDPHSSNGFTTSEVRGDWIIPEYSTVEGGNVPMREGAEMWRMSRAGDEVLVGIFDGRKWVRVG